MERFGEGWNDMKLIYVANIRLPTEKAYGVQIMKTCEAIARLGIDVRLIIPTRKSIAFAGVNPFEHYGVEKNFTIQRIPTIDPWWLIRLPPGWYIKAQALLIVNLEVDYESISIH